MCSEEYEAAVAAFIRRNGVTRCPTACALPTQAAPAAADQAALQRYAALRSRSRRQQAAGLVGAQQLYAHTGGGRYFLDPVGHGVLLQSFR